MAEPRQRVYSMPGQNNHLENSEIGKHFLQDSFKRRTIYDIIKCSEIGLLVEDLPRSARLTSFNGKNFKRLKNAAANCIDVSQSKLGKKFSVAQSTIHYNLKKVGLKYSKRQMAPKYNKNQFEQVAKKVSKTETSNCNIKHLHYC